MQIGLRLAIVAAGGLLAIPVADGAPPAFKGNVCKVLTTSQVTAIQGVSGACKNVAPLTGPGPGSTQYEGDWAGTSSTSPSLQVTIVKYTDAGMLQLATRNLKQGLPGTPAQNVTTTIGVPAYQGKGAFSASIHLAVGKYIAYITLTQIHKTPSPTLLYSVAKDVAAKL